MEQKRGLDSILDEIGYVGRSPIFYFVLILFITFYMGVQGLAHIFTVGDLKYRYPIDECDKIRPVYKPDCLKYAVPFEDDSELPKQCYKYIFFGDNSTGSTCTVSDFDNKFKSKCDNFVFENDETEFKLPCKENKWKLLLPATIHNTGLLVNLLIIGYISDQLGRKTVFVISPILAAIVGIIEPFASNYTTYVVLKFIETYLSGGTYSASVVLAIELVSPPHRAMVGTLIFISASLGKLFLGFIAMFIGNWKTRTFFNFIPSLLAITYIWIISESLKWLLVKARYDDIADTLLHIIQFSNVEVSPEIKEILRKQPEIMAQDKPANRTGRYSIWSVFRSRPMLIRIVSLAFCWITNVFIFYGLTLISVSIGGNKYLNFIIVNIMEVPACILVILMSYRIGCKKLFCQSFILSGVLLLVYPFVTDFYWIKLIVFMLGKFAITISFSTIYVFTSEVIPTNLRQTLFDVCSTIGRIGSIIAPQSTLLDLHLKNLPIFLFCGSALAAGLLSLQLPETLNTKLPDTIDEALRIGKTTQNNIEEEAL